MILIVLNIMILHVLGEGRTSSFQIFYNNITIRIQEFLT